MLNENERDIINKILAGNDEYFEKIVDEYKNKIYNFALNMLYDRETAEEAALEVFYKFYKDLKNFKGECKISTYLYQIAKNQCKDLLKKKKLKTMPLDDVEDLISGADTPEQAYLKKEERKQMLAAVNSIEKEYKEILILRELAELSYQEIAEVLHLNLNTVKTNIRRARVQVISKIAEVIQNER